MIRHYMLFLAFCLGSSSLLPAQRYTISRTNDLADATTQAYKNVGPGDTVWLEPGLRASLIISDFHGTQEKPVVFSNRTGQVVIDTDLSYGISFRACSYFIVAGLPGAGFQYGIKIARIGGTGGSGISIGNKSTNVVVYGCEVTNTHFAGIIAKTEPTCEDPGTYRNSFTQYNTVVRNCYIHDVPGEGLYIGSTSFSGQFLASCSMTVLPPVLVGVQICYNRIERTGWDGIQVSSAVQDCSIHHNILRDCGNSMTTNQMSGVNIGGGTLAKCFNNQIFDSYGDGILLFGNGGTEVYNNLIVRPGRRYFPDNPDLRVHGIFVADKTQVDKTWYGIYQNTIIQPKSDGIRIDNTVDFETRIYNNALIDPGAFDVYENDNTDRTGPDAYIYDASRLHQYRAESNYFSRLLLTAGFSTNGPDNFRLRQGSPLIDLGKSLYTIGIRKDLDDHDRPAGITYDIGAYEYSPGLSAGELPLTDSNGFVSCQVLSSGIIRLSLNSEENQRIRIRISDLAGRVIYSQYHMLTGNGIQLLEFQVPCHGLMILSVNGEKTNYAGKIVLF